MISNLISILSTRLLTLSTLCSRSVFSSHLTNLMLGLMLSILVCACGPSAVSFKSFDMAEWKSESITCTNYRNSVINAMEAEFELFLGMNEVELTGYLGNPDETLLYTRGQKFFNYYLTCHDQSSNTRKLRIRFSALDQVNEVLILD